MGYEESLRAVKMIAILDIVSHFLQHEKHSSKQHESLSPFQIFSIFPIFFYTVFTFIFGFVVMVGYFNSGYLFLDWILANTMTIQEVQVDFENPGQAADLRAYRCAVWGIAILFNLLELTMGFILLHAIRRSVSIFFKITNVLSIMNMTIFRKLSSLSWFGSL